MSKLTKPEAQKHIKMFFPILIQFRERSGKCTRQMGNAQGSGSRIKGFVFGNNFYILRKLGNILFVVD